MTLAAPEASQHTVGNAEEWWHALGDVPLSRIVMNPLPGTATEKDLLRFVEVDTRLVELIDGTLVEKPMGWLESQLALRLAMYLMNFITPRNLGGLAGKAGTLKMANGRIRLPDLSFITAEDLEANRPLPPIPRVPFRLAVEILSESNTPGEMKQKLKEYFRIRNAADVDH